MWLISAIKEFEGTTSICKMSKEKMNKHPNLNLQMMNNFTKKPENGTQAE
jgi:hypothetical protein